MFFKKSKVPTTFLYNLLLKLLFIFFIFIGYANFNVTKAQQGEEEFINYFQMEPLDDSLFIQIQTEVFIDPPDPKAEIIVDLRDPTNQTVTISGVLYPYLAFTPETRARIFTYPFKIDLSKGVTFTSVFKDVIEKINLKKIVAPPTKHQISSTMQYINPFFQLFGGERFGFPINQDIGVSFGLGTPYSGALETNFLEANFHIIGVKIGYYSHVNELFRIAQTDNVRNNIYVFYGYQISYVLPFGNFFEINYIKNLDAHSDATFEHIYKEIYNEKYDKYEDKAKQLNGKEPLILRDSYLNWEFRYPLSMLGSTRGKVYVAHYLDEWHTGFMGREMSLAGSTFDFRFDAMVSSKVREPQYAFDLLVQKVFDMWAFSAIAIGPSAVLTKLDSGDFGVTTLFINMRFKFGTSL